MKIAAAIEKMTDFEKSKIENGILEMKNPEGKFRGFL